MAVINSEEIIKVIIKNIKEFMLLGKVKLYGSGYNKDIIIKGEHLNTTDDNFDASILINHITYRF